MTKHGATNHPTRPRQPNGKPATITWKGVIFYWSETIGRYVTIPEEER